MEKEFVPVELALKLKSLGFDDVFCFAVYNPIHNGYALQSGKYNSQYEITILAPLWQQSFDWFREKHNKHAIIYKIEISEGVYNWDWDIVVGNDEDEMEFDLPLCETYYEARLACLEKLIELTTQH